MTDRRRVVAWLLGASLLAFRPAAAGEGRPKAAEPPQQNSSYVPEDDEGVKRALADADRAVEAKDWVQVAHALQRVVDGSKDAVLPVSEGGVFEGAAIVVQHRLARLGPSALAAYELEYGGPARSVFSAAVAAGDERSLYGLVERWLPAAAGRRAALILADVALERGDADAALGFLERLEDFHDALAPEAAESFRAEKEAWLTRTAIAYASTHEAVVRVKAWLVDPAAPRPAREDFRAPPTPTDWTTSAGNASRSLVPPTIAGRLEFASDNLLHYVASAQDEGGRGDDGSDPERGRPSPWLPPRAVVSGDRVLVSDGRYLQAYSFETGRLLAGLDAWPLAEGVNMHDLAGVSADDARRRFGLIEGTGLTVSGDTAYATVPYDRDQAEAETAEAEPPPFVRLFPPSRPPPRPPAKRARLDHVAAIRVEGPDAGRILWRAGGLEEEAGLPKGTRLYGTPLLYRGSLYVGGVRPSDAKDDSKQNYRWETYLVALDPATGTARFATFLGAGGPIRRKNSTEVMPSSCAAANGRVFLVTALGLASAVDAASGRASWTLRYDRGLLDGDDQARRLSDSPERGPRRSSFANEPPILFGLPLEDKSRPAGAEVPTRSGGRCFFTPTDSQWLYATFSRPRGPGRLLTAWKRNRTKDFVNLALEHLAGATDGTGGVPPTLVGVGQGYLGTDELHTSVVGMDPASGFVRWGRALPDGEHASPYGRALVTETQVFVSTRVGIASYRVADGAELPFLSAAGIPAPKREWLQPSERLWGNLVPVPGRGLVAVNEDYVAFWHSR